MFIGVDEQFGQLFWAKQNKNKKRVKVIDDPFIHRIQHRHFIRYNVLPVVGTGIAIASLPYFSIGLMEVGLFIGMWFLTGIGITVGYHRYFSHRSFQTNRIISVILCILGSMAALGSTISWVAIHRRHHECADKLGDMHSPNLHGKGFMDQVKGFIHAHFTWMNKHEYPNVSHYVPDLLRDPVLLKVSRLYQYWVLLGVAIPAVIGGLVTGTWAGVLTGFLWGGVVRLFIVANFMWTLNSVLHRFGSQPFPMEENSRNSYFLSIFAWGEGWHNNHHAFPTSAHFGLKKL